MFTLNKYESILNNLKSQGFYFSTDWSKSDSNTILLRHDIDFSVEEALKIADLEASLKVKSTFFFMLSSNMYNLMSKANKRLVNEIDKMGHKISLHFDPVAYSNLNSFIDEKNCFERFFGTTVDIVSIHRPGVFLQNNNQDLFGIRHTYQNHYFNDMAYISDSGGKSVDEKIANYISQRNLHGLQLLLHPIWWTRESDSPTETINLWRESNASFISKEIILNCKTYEA